MVFINSLTLVAFLSQQIKLFCNEDTDHCNKNYIICWLLDSTYGHTKIYIIHIKKKSQYPRVLYSQYQMPDNYQNVSHSRSTFDQKNHFNFFSFGSI